MDGRRSGASGVARPGCHVAPRPAAQPRNGDPMSQTRSPARRAGLVLLVAALVVVAALLVLFLVARRSVATDGPASSAVTTPATSTPSPAASAPSTTHAPTTNPTTGDAQDSGPRAAGRGPRAEPSWTGLRRPMGSAAGQQDRRDHRPGQTAANGSHTFRYADIQVQFDQLSAVARSAGWTPLVVTADDFGTKRTEHGEQMWVLLADGRWASKAQAQVSCAALFPQVAAAELPNWCVPRTLVAPPR